MPTPTDTKPSSPAPHASREYLRNVVMTASPEQLHLMLLDGAIRFATQGRAAIVAGNIDAMFTALERAQRIVLELSSGLRREVDPLLVDRMAALYTFIFRRLTEANLHRDTQAADDALRILRHQRETWSLLLDKLAKGSPALHGTNPQPVSAPAGDAGTPRFVIEG